MTKIEKIGLLGTGMWAGAIAITIEDDTTGKLPLLKFNYLQTGQGKKTILPLICFAKLVQMLEKSKAYQKVKEKVI